MIITYLFDQELYLMPLNNVEVNAVLIQTD